MENCKNCKDCTIYYKNNNGIGCTGRDEPCKFYENGKKDE